MPVVAEAKIAREAEINERSKERYNEIYNPNYREASALQRAQHRDNIARKRSTFK